MFSFEEACNLALQAMRKHGVSSISEPIDIGSEWIFKPYDPDSVLIGAQPIAVNKKTGRTRVFFLPDEKHFEQLENGTPWDLPKQYTMQ